MSDGGSDNGKESGYDTNSSISEDDPHGVNLRYRGNHSMLDYTNCFIKKKNTEAVFLSLIGGFKTICKSNGLRVVGERMELFDGSLSPSGGTFVLLLDESHISLHSYGEEGLIAIDLFTCCKNPQNHIDAMMDIRALMAIQFSQNRLLTIHSIPRFATR